MLKNALDATRAAGAKFAYFDNTYMYPQDARVQTEDTPFAPVGRKGRVRAEMASMVLEEIERGEIPVLIGRAPEFYGPGRTQSITNTLIIDNLVAGKKPRVPVRDDRLRTLIWTPDASRALAALGNTPDAFGQTWHLPCCDDRPTYKELVAMAAEAFGRDAGYAVIGKWALNVAGLFSSQVRELRELLPRYEHDNLFDSTKFATRFLEFDVTAYRDGLDIIRGGGSRSSPLTRVAGGYRSTPSRSWESCAAIRPKTSVAPATLDGSIPSNAWWRTWRRAAWTLSSARDPSGAMLMRNARASVGSRSRWTSPAFSSRFRRGVTEETSTPWQAAMSDTRSAPWVSKCSSSAQEAGGRS